MNRIMRVVEEQRLFSQTETIDVMALVDSIVIPTHWLEVDKTSKKQNQVPVDTDFLHALGLEVASKEAMKQERWEQCLHAMYRKVNQSRQPEARLLWELFLRKGISSLGQFIETTTVEDIIAAADQPHVKKAFDKRGYPQDKVMRGEIWWNEDMAGKWYRILLRMFDPHAGLIDEQGCPNSALIIELAELLLNDAVIPFVRKQIKLGVSREIDLCKSIEDAIRVIEVNRLPHVQEQVEIRVSRSVRITLDAILGV